MVNVIKKNGEHQKFNAEKIRRAIRKSATRVCVELTDKEEKQVVDGVKKQLQFQETDIFQQILSPLLLQELGNTFNVCSDLL